MKTRKKLVQLLTILVMITWQSVFTQGALITALAEQDSREVTISPYMTIISDCSTSLSISSSGEATIQARVTGMSGTTKVEITAVLEKYENSKWTPVETFVNSSSTTWTSINEKYSVSKGTYRVSTTVKAYMGTSSESKSLTSASKTY